ncbi:hypothetical protein [uncultured virus]|uniref:Uncharacterized protein n=1 Tax=uncultured virus TaxID=340016 RepID=A0A218MMS8_9VIRU|nr:hypothetical protein [uncultured virus]
MIKNPFSRIIKIQDRMFQVNRIFPENRIKINEYENWASLLKQYYHVDTILRANEQLWLCNEIQTVSYVEIKN